MSARLRATFLTGESVYIRSLVLEDKEHAAAWYPGLFPVNGSRAEEFLRDEHKGLDPRDQNLAIVALEGDAIVGGVTLWTDYRASDLTFHLAPWRQDADALRAEALTLLVPWLRDGAEMMTTATQIAADEPLTIAAAEELGMRRGATLRQWLARPGHRVDVHWYEALNPNWRVEGPGDA